MSAGAPVTLEGAISITAALEADSRAVYRLLLRRGPVEREASRLIRRCEAQAIPVERVGDDELEKVANGRSHGGMVALVGSRRTVELADLLPVQGVPFIAMLDGVEDPFNWGQAIRALYASGAHGLVTRPRQWENAASVIARSSAGASERMMTAIAQTADEAAAFFRAHGLLIAVTDKERAVSIYEANLAGPLFLLIGGERRGVTRSFADSADMRLKIPYGRNFPLSLGTTPAAAVLAFEVMRQRLIAQK